MRMNTELVRVDVADAGCLQTQLTHRLTMLSGDSNRHGVTVWGHASSSAVIYWNWTLTDEGIPVLADQLAIRSNLLFVGGAALPYEEQLLRLNQVVHSLEWQPRVVDHVQRLFRQTVVSDAGNRSVSRSRHRSTSPQRLAA